MESFRWQTIVAAAIIVPVLSILAGWAAKKIGRWFLRSAGNSFGQVVVDVMAPEMAHQSAKVTHSLDELQKSNTAQHHAVEGRLTGVEDRLGDVETRLATVETLLNIRPADARTRATDRETDEH